MYSAPPSALPSKLDAIAPLSVAPWRRHLHFCIYAGPDARAQAQDPRFGYEGTLHDEPACLQAGGY